MLRIESLAKSYGDNPAIGDVSFEVSEREFVCVVGPSGCGKTTLLKCMSGLLAPTGGRVLLHDSPVLQPPEEMALVFQEYSRSLLPWMSVRNNVTLPLRRKKLDKGERARLVEEAVEAVGLTGHLDRYPWQLSGGMQQRVAIARALAYQPQILLMDEPFASVDAQTRADLEDLILEVRERYDVTIVFVTHDIDESIYLSDRIVVLGPSPTAVKEILQVDLPRPRDQVDTKELPEFAHQRAHVYRLIKREEARVALIAYADLLELVLERNPFHQARLAGWERGSELPPLTKSELVADQAAHPPFGTNLTYELDRYVAMHQTSGTTGPPLRVLDTAGDWAWWRACLARSFEEIGIGADDRVALAFSFGPHIHFWATKEGLQEVGAMAVACGGMTSAQRLQTIADTSATALACTPTYALRLHEVAVEQRMEGALESIRAVVCTGEPGGSLPAVRSAIEEAFGAPVFDHAGSTEAGPFGYPCAEGGGLHLDESQFACEIVDAGLEPAAPGERGELLVTPLGRTGFPVLRYRTGDVVLNTDERCPGGHEDRWLPGGIVGRTDDMVVIRGMNVFPSAVEEAVRSVSGSGEFRITFYTEPGGMDEIKLEVELEDGSRARRLQEVMRHQLGLRIRIVPVAAGVLPRSESKSRRVVDLRERGWT